LQCPAVVMICCLSVVVVCDASVVYCDNLHDPNLSLTRRVTTEVRITRFLHKSTVRT